jgi:hypothetical protein
MDFDEEKSLEFANMISDPLGSEGVIAREEAEIAMNGIEQKLKEVKSLENIEYT